MTIDGTPTGYPARAIALRPYRDDSIAPRVRVPTSDPAGYREGEPVSPGCVNGVVVASSTKPSRRRIGRLSGEASTCR